MTENGPVYSTGDSFGLNRIQELNLMVAQNFPGASITNGYHNPQGDICLIVTAPGGREKMISFDSWEAWWMSDVASAVCSTIKTLS